MTKLYEFFLVIWAAFGLVFIITAISISRSFFSFVLYGQIAAGVAMVLFSFFTIKAQKTRNKFFMNVSYILALIPCVLPVFWIVNYFYFNHSNKDNKCITHG
ncbi:MAG TPA: hypothetical protein DIC30_12460 [Oceanospirillales bacterium]|nr:hypothetical protein [Oceanospirillales bacterium]|tara:strand:+ start:1320 stop:1625 length:306 start_codon:yes stop_codon:yes gene_type:complete